MDPACLAFCCSERGKVTVFFILSQKSVINTHKNGTIFSHLMPVILSLYTKY